MTRRSDRDSDTELEKYKPSVEASLQLADHAAAEERIRKALESPELQAMLAAEGRSVEFTPLPPAPTSPTSTAASTAADTSAPSPWAKEASRAAAVDPAMLPSANAPVAPPAVRSKKKRAPNQEREARVAAPARKGGWTPTRKALVAVVCSFLPALIVIVLFVKPQQEAARNVPPPSTREAPALPVATSTTPPLPSAVESVEPTPAPRTHPTTSARAAPAVTPRLRQRSRATSDDPYDAVPSRPARTADPQPSVAPKAIEAAATPPPPTTATEPEGLPYQKNR